MTDVSLRRAVLSWVLLIVIGGFVAWAAEDGSLGPQPLARRPIPLGHVPDR